MKTKNDIRLEIDKTLATIETIAKEIRCSKSYVASSREFDAVAREIKMHTDHVKDLAYELDRAIEVVL